MDVANHLAILLR